MKTKTLTNRILIVFMTLFGLIGYVTNVSGQCSACNTTCSPTGAMANGNCSFAQGVSASAPGANSIAIGNNSIGGTTSNSNGYAIGTYSHAQAGTSFTFGCKITTASSATGNMVLGTGGLVNFSNAIDHSIMLGTNMSGTVPTVYIENGAEDNGS